MSEYSHISVSSAILPKSKAEDSQEGNIPVPHFKRKKQESVGAYLRRMDNETKHVLFLTKNQVERKPELDADKQEKSVDKGKSEKKKEWVHFEKKCCFFKLVICDCANMGFQ